MGEKQEAIEDKMFDKLSDLNVSKSSSTKDLIDKKKDSSENGDKNIVISQDQRESTAVKHISGLGEENGKVLASEDSKKDGKTATKKTLDGDSKASRQSDARQIVSSLKESVKDVQVTSEEKEKASTKQISNEKVVAKESAAEDAELKEDKDWTKHDDIKFSQKMQAEKQKTEAFTERSTDDDKYLDDSARGKSADLSSTEPRASMLNVEESLSPERMGSSHDQKLERVKRNDKERPETKAGKLPKYIRTLNVLNYKNVISKFQFEF